MIPYRTIRSNRKTLGIYITQQAEVEVRAPLQISDEKIAQFVAERKAWIHKYLFTMQNRVQKRSEFLIGEGDHLRYLGGQFPVVFEESAYLYFDGEKFHLPRECNISNIIHLYRKLAEGYILPRVAKIAQEVKIAPQSVRITSAATRWGSCSGKNSLCFSWRLIMADVCDIDYVIYHELMHIREHNHSRRFWALVSQSVPEYKACHGRLKELAVQLAEENWKI